MTISEAKLLNKGDFVGYRNLKYKVLSIKECRSAHTNEPFINIKVRRQNETMWLSNDFADKIWVLLTKLWRIYKWGGNNDK